MANRVCLAAIIDLAITIDTLAFPVGYQGMGMVAKYALVFRKPLQA
jgi:hypothetical protein